MSQDPDRGFYNGSRNSYEQRMDYNGMNGIDEQQQQRPQYIDTTNQPYLEGPPIYKSPVYTRKERAQVVEVIEVEDVDCSPNMCYNQAGLMRWFQLAMFFLLQWLVQITCGNDACTMIMNVFGYIAMGQLFVLLILLFLSIVCSLLLIATSLNGHKAFGNILLPIERLYAMIGVVLMFIAGILGTWMAIQTTDVDVNYQGRGKFHIRGQWIAAAVFEFLMVGVFIFDLMLQKKENYPFSNSVDEEEEEEEMVEQYEQKQQTVYREEPTIRTTTTTQRQQYFTDSAI